jgi:flagellar L-ring protein precursor FlgH
MMKQQISAKNTKMICAANFRASMLKNTVLPLMLVVVSGCSAVSRNHPVVDDPNFAPIPPQALMAPPAVNGAIFQTGRGYGLYTDRIAHHIGDVLTVTLQERTQSSKSSDTSYVKDNKIDFAEGNILGSAVSYGNLSMATDLDFKRDFSGKADSDLSNSLSGSITVTVSDVLPNGLLKIRGEKWLTLNQGDEYIRLSGLVRSEDISDNNTVLSSKIADARISYGATGDFDSANRMGWGSKFFNSEWWPF